MGYKRSKLNKLEIQKRRNDALSLLAAGYTYDKIAERLGYNSKQAAHKDLRVALNAHQEKRVQEYRDLEMERCDAATRAIYPKVMKGDIKAIDSMLRIMARRARYVPNLEVPQEHELSTGDGTVQVVFHHGLGDKVVPDPEPGTE